MNKNRINFFWLKLTDIKKTDEKNLYKTTDILNNDKLAIVSWLKNSWKMNFIKQLIIRTWSNNSYFYFNKSEDINNTIKKSWDLEKLLFDYTRLYKNPKIVILQNIEEIEWVKDFISNIYSKNFKIVLFWNFIKIWWIKEVEILNEIHLTENNLQEKAELWFFKQINELENINSKKKYIKLLKSDILLNDIFNNFNVKNIDLFNFTLSYIAENSFFTSLRELHKNLNAINNISLKTVIDYIDFSIQAKIIKRVYKYDLKTNKQITTKAKYYFTDNWIRNSLANFDVNKNILLENLIFSILEYNNYTIYGWLNWKFEFSFLAKPLSCPMDTPSDKFFSPSQEKEATICVHISRQTKREEIKKEVKKLLKIWSEWKKYLLIDSISKLWIKKRKYDSVEIVEVSDFLVSFGK